MSVWNHQNRVVLYQAVNKHIGNMDCWKAQAPNNLNTEETFEAFEIIYEEIAIPENFPNKLPKSGKALFNQVKWALTTQITDNSGYIKNRYWNRLAALDAKFMTSEQLVNLELAQAVSQS